MDWQTSARDPRDSYVPVEVSVDDRPANQFALLRHSEAAGDLTTFLRVRRGTVESPGMDEVLRRSFYAFDGKGLPVTRVLITGLGQVPLEFRFDTLSATQRAQIVAACFALDEKRLAESACRKQARARAIEAFEARVFEANREWCETTRDARRQQLVAEFLRGVGAARNGGTRVAAAFAQFIATNPDVVMPEDSGSTQSCPDPHFLIDTKRLRPLLERTAPGQVAQADVAARQLAELLNETGVIVTTAQLQFAQPQPRMNYAAWTATVAKAEAQCTVRNEGR